MAHPKNAQAVQDVETQIILMNYSFLKKILPENSFPAAALSVLSGDESALGDDARARPSSMVISSIVHAAARKREGVGVIDNSLKFMEEYSATKKLADIMKRHQEAPEFGSVTSLSRSSVPAAELTEKELRSAGFVPSYIAVPETGQTEMRTWRNPFNNMHFHRHGDRWLYHVDNYPSLSMQLKALKELRRAGMTTKDISKKDMLKQLGLGTKHVLQEGFPGYVTYGTGTILGDRGFGYEDNRTLMQRAPRAAAGLLAAAGLVSGASRLAGAWNPAESLGGVAATVGAKKLMDALYASGVASGRLSKMPTWKGTAMLGATPLLAGVLTYAGINKLRKMLRDRRKDAQMRGN